MILTENHKKKKKNPYFVAENSFMIQKSVWPIQA